MGDLGPWVNTIRFSRVEEFARDTITVMPTELYGAGYKFQILDIKKEGKQYSVTVKVSMVGKDGEEKGDR